MKPTVFTYHQKIPTWNHSGIIGVWRRNWQRNGWRTVILGREAAKQHPRYGEVITRVRTYPSVNDWQYEEACYVRWLAFAVMIKITDGRALMTDYDVINLNFRPEHFGRDDVICHESTRVPCMVESNQKGADAIIDFLMSRQIEPDCRHYSDMYAFKESDWPISNLCLEFGDPKWQEALAVHVASGAVQRAQPGADKTEFIRARF